MIDSGNSLLASVVVLQHNDFGGIETRLGDLCLDKRGDLYIRGRKLLFSSEETVDVSGCPSQAVSKKHYFELLEKFQGGIDVLPDYTVAELFQNVALTEPSNTIYQGLSASCLIYAQSALDLPRSNWIRYNNQTLFDGHKDQGATPEETTRKIFEKLVQVTGYNVAAANRLSILLTQGCMGRAASVLWKKFSNPMLQLQLSNRGPYYKNIKLLSHGILEIQQTSFFALFDMDNSSEILKWTKVQREMTVSLDDLKSGMCKASKAKDIFYPFYNTFSEANSSEIGMAAPSRCTLF